MKFFTVLFVLALGATDARAAGAGSEIAVLLKGMSNPYWKTLYDGVVETAKAQGLLVYVQGIQSDSAAEEQLNLCHTMLLRKPKALIFAAVNNVNLTSCLRQAQQHGVVLVDVDGGTDHAAAKKMGIDLRFSVASDNYALGKKAAEYLRSVRGKVLIIEGFPGSIPALQRVQGFRQHLHAGLEIVASISADWDRLKAASIAIETVTRHPDLRVIFAANDTMALGATEALHARGVRNVKVIGVDGVRDAVKAIQRDRLTASIAQLPYLMGQEALVKTDAYLRGSTQMDFDQRVPVVTLDKQVLSRNANPLLKHVR